MGAKKYLRFKHVAKATAIAVASMMLLTGCGDTKEEEKKEMENIMNNNDVEEKKKAMENSFNNNMNNVNNINNDYVEDEIIEETEEETSEEYVEGEEIYVEQGGNYVPYAAAIASGAVLGAGAVYATKAANGKFKSYKPTSSEMAAMKSGKFNGKVSSRPVVNKNNINSSSNKGSSSSIKSFGSSSSRSTSTGG